MSVRVPILRHLILLITWNTTGRREGVFCNLYRSLNAESQNCTIQY